MYSILSLKYFQIIVFITFLFGINSYDDDYDYEYGPGQAEHQFGGFRSFPRRSISKIKAYDGEVVRNSNEEGNLMDDLLNPNLSTREADMRVPAIDTSAIRARIGGACPDKKCFRCLDSCRHLKKSRVASNTLIQYTYLRLCSMGCKEELDCLANNYCLPVMQENPDYFVQCSSKCNLFLIVPKIFKTGNKC